MKFFKIALFITLFVASVLSIGCNEKVVGTSEKLEIDKLTHRIKTLENSNKKLSEENFRLKDEIYNLNNKIDNNSSLSGNNLNTIPLNMLTGVWQDAPSIGSGYGDKYHFFKDGTFIFTYAQGDEERRNIDLSGKWELKDNLLILFVLKRTILVNGDFIKSELNPEGYRLVNAAENTIKYEKPLEIIYPLKDYKEGTVENQMPDEVKIGGISYWKLSTYSEDYLD